MENKARKAAGAGGALLALELLAVPLNALVWGWLATQGVAL